MKAILLISLSLFFISCSSSNKSKLAENPDHQCVYNKDYKGCKEKLKYFNRYNDVRKFKSLWSLVCSKKSFKAKCYSEKVLERDIASKVLLASKRKVVFRFDSDTTSTQLYYLRK